MSPGMHAEFAAAIKRGAPWLSAEGAESDVVISSRVRLARNFAGFAFLAKASRTQRLEILQQAHERLQAAGIGERLLWVDVHDIPPLDRTLMVERHLISKEHARGVVPGATPEADLAAAGSAAPASGPGGGGEAAPTSTPRNEPRAAAISLPDETVSVMVNEEDHLRLQALVSGLELSAAFARINQVDDRIEGPRPGGGEVTYAFNSRFGYLTCCPTNVGTGIRVSVMLHLPALKLSGEIDKVKRATRDMSIAVRGYYGEGSEAAGELYQISNQTTLGKPESVILHEIEREIVPQIIGYERAARRMLLERRRRLLEDKVFRALGLLRGARLLTPEEATSLLSDVRLGIVSGLIPDVAQRTVNQLILLTQPAHLQRALGRDMDQNERREARADLVRAQLKSA